MATRRPELAELTAVKKSDFQPNKIYTWDANEKFVVTGQEIDILNKALATQTEDKIGAFQKFLWLQRGLETMNNILKEAYDDGLIQEQEQKPKGPVPETVVEEAKSE